VATGAPSKSEKESLWEQIALKLRGIIRTFKEREFSYQNTIHHLRTENSRLLGLHQEEVKKESIERSEHESSTPISPLPSFEPPKVDDNDVLLRMIRMNSSDSKLPDDAEKMVKFSRLSIGSIK
jgi:hypothetical protein